MLEERILREPPTPTISCHVRSILDLTNYPPYLLYVLEMRVYLRLNRVSSQ
uniref:Orf42 n=1 Tax=Torreya grandis TaxID=58047 RepID=A0A2Z2GV88_9CONI|nr:orf42 [Torreya grandis]ARR75341.1 orf42 [Torreya grandis]